MMDAKIGKATRKVLCQGCRGSVEKNEARVVLKIAGGIFSFHPKCWMYSLSHLAKKFIG